LGFIASQLFILRPLDRGDSLVLRYAACNRLLNGVTDIHQHLSITEKLFPALLGVGGRGLCPGTKISASRPAAVSTVFS
jgi:hypothetical protein